MKGYYPIQNSFQVALSVHKGNIYEETFMRTQDDNLTSHSNHIKPLQCPCNAVQVDPITSDSWAFGKNCHTRKLIPFCSILPARTEAASYQFSILRSCKQGLEVYTKNINKVLCKRENPTKLILREKTSTIIIVIMHSGMWMNGR